MRRGRNVRSRTFSLSVERENFSTLLARPILLNGCPRSFSNPSLSRNVKPLEHYAFSRIISEREGFEPSVPCGTPVFETGALDHSATSPIRTMLATTYHTFSEQKNKLLWPNLRCFAGLSSE